MTCLENLAGLKRVSNLTICITTRLLPTIVSTGTHGIPSPTGSGSERWISMGITYDVPRGRKSTGRNDWRRIPFFLFCDRCIHKLKSSLSPCTRPGVHRSHTPQQGMNFEGPIPLCPCCKRPSLYRSQYSRTAYKCSYCHAVFRGCCGLAGGGLTPLF